MSEPESSAERLARLKDRLIETELLAQCGASFVNPNCLDYAKSLVKDFYVVSDDGEFEVTDATPLNQRDLQPMSISELGAYLQQTHGYLFREAPPSLSTATTAPPPPPNKAEMDVAARCAYIRAHGEAAYQTLPDNPVQALPLAKRPRSTWTVEERARYIREHGQDAYLSLPA